MVQDKPVIYNTIKLTTAQAGKTKFYLGIMSGTSADGIDLALVDCQEQHIELIASHFIAYDHITHQAITALYQPDKNELDRAMALSVALAKLFANAVNELLTHLSLPTQAIIAIGNHGQTIRHRPDINDAFTTQIVCNHTLSTLTNIRVIGEFRQKDIAYGGQGAPLVPAFHQQLFRQYSNQEKDAFVVNIGGIANLTYLPLDKNKPVQGFDTGPGNCLLDSWYQQHHTDSYDHNGAWAQSGLSNTTLLSLFLNDSYFSAPAPKSTGREYFHLAWLEEKLNHITTNAIAAADIQASLLSLTATTIAKEIKQLSQDANIYLCGGGALNQPLVNELKTLLNHYQVTPISALNLDSDSLEAMAFAWLAYAFDEKLSGNLPSVTGARKAVVLGVEYLP